jgi:hypothetical protein
MERLPPLAAEAADPSRRGRQRERHHEHQRREADGDVGPLVDILANRGNQVAQRAPRHDTVGEIDQAGEPIGNEVGREVERAVEEGEEADHPAEPNDDVPTGEPPQRRDRKRRAEEPERPHAGFIGHVAERIRAERARQQSPEEPRGGNESRRKGDRFQNESDDVGGRHR